MKAFSLFSGIGGFDLALQRQGIEMVGACEIDKYARSVYQRRFPGVRVWNDATKIDPKEVPNHDILAFGFPCQSFSVAGSRGGFSDTRGTLFFEGARIAKEKRPPILLMENVLGLLSHDKGQTMSVILATLDEMGYEWEYQVFISKHWVPQNRERVLIIGYSRESGRRKIFPIEGDGGKTSGLRKVGLVGKDDQAHRVYSTDGISSTLASEGGGLGAKTGLYKESKIKRIEGNPNVYNTDAQGGKIYDPEGISPTVSGQRVNSQGYIKEPKVKKIGSINNSQSGSVYSTDGISTTLCAGGGGQGAKTGLYKTGKIKKIGGYSQGSAVYDADGIFGTLSAGTHGYATGNIKVQSISTIQPHATVMDECAPALTCKHEQPVVRPIITPDRIERRKQNGRRIKDDGDPAFTQTATDQHGIMIDDRIRRLTPTECERLQGFPDQWTKLDVDGNEVSDTQRYRMLGNAVTVDVVQFLLRCMMLK